MTVKAYPWINQASETTSSPPKFYICDTETERDALASVVEGSLAYTKDSDTLASYDGSGWDEPLSQYAPGSFTVPTERFAVMVETLTLSGSETLTLEGTSTLRIL